MKQVDLMGGEGEKPAESERSDKPTKTRKRSEPRLDPRWGEFFMGLTSDDALELSKQESERSDKPTKTRKRPGPARKTTRAEKQAPEKSTETVSRKADTREPQGGRDAFFGSVQDMLFEGMTLNPTARRLFEVAAVMGQYKLRNENKVSSTTLMYAYAVIAAKPMPIDQEAFQRYWNRYFAPDFDPINARLKSKAPPELTSSAIGLVLLAAGIAHSGKHEQFSAIHLVAAAFSGEDEILTHRIEAWGVKLEQLRQWLFNEIIVEYDPESLDFWRGVLNLEVGQAEPKTVSQAEVLISRFLADTNHENQQDLIGSVDEEAEAFAYFLTYVGTKPPLAVGLFGDWGWLQNINHLIAGFSSAAAGIAAYGKFFVDKANKAMNGLQTTRDMLDGLFVEKASEEKKELNEAEEALEKARRELELAQARLEQAEEHFQSAQLEAREGDARLRLRKFIQERIREGAYSQHLGIVAQIRKDFEYLSTLMLKGRKELEEMKLPVPKEDVPHFDRIILYIDDLDRCPPERVIEVLQAVHLLLAFELFVVVVAVDVRWVTRALSKTYRDMLLEKGESQSEGHLRSATAGDYLEKIFQIPFWVRPMDGEQAGSFMKNLLTLQNLDGSQERNSKPDASKIEEPAVQAEPVKSRPTDEVEVEQDDSGQPARIDDVEAPKGDEAVLDEVNVNLVARFMEMQPEEAVLLQQLAQLMAGSPRRLKRFLNVYRLIKTSISIEQPNLFSEDEQVYRLVLSQLAVITGLPKVMDPYVSYLKDAENLAGFKQLLAGEKQDAASAGDWRQLNETLKTANVLNERDYPHLLPWAKKAMRYAFRISGKTEQAVAPKEPESAKSKALS